MEVWWPLDVLVAWNMWQALHALHTHDIFRIQFTKQLFHGLRDLTSCKTISAIQQQDVHDVQVWSGPGSLDDTCHINVTILCMLSP